MIQPLLTETGCRRRQYRLQQIMEQSDWDFFLTGNPRTIYSLTSALLAPERQAFCLLSTNGQSTLISPHTGLAFVDQMFDVPAYSPIRPVVSPVMDAAKQLHAILPNKVARIGVELEYTPAAAMFVFPPTFTVEAGGAAIRCLRRTKDEDEREEVLRSLRLNAIAYDAARRSIRPGLTEIELYRTMSHAVANELGTSIRLAGDFSCGTRSLTEGGAATTRVIQANELCVLDLFIAPAFYFGDTCRTFCAGTPRNDQLEAWQLVCDTLSATAKVIRPGKSAREVYQVAKATLDANPLTNGSFWHHAGHGIGCQGHEAPRLIPESLDIIEKGDLVAVEPGIYVESLGGGMRLENTFQVEADGAKNLFDYPLTLELV